MNDAPNEKESSIAKRQSVNFTRRGQANLEDLVARTGLPRTDVVNRALAVYAFYEAESARGVEFFTREPGSDQMTRLRII